MEIVVKNQVIARTHRLKLKSGSATTSNKVI
jgi:hypothetical protein